MHNHPKTEGKKMEIPEGKLNKKQKQQREKGKVQGSRTNIV